MAEILEDTGRLIFGQPHFRTAEWFEKNVESNSTLPIERFPHYAMAKDGDRASYENYLKNSWHEASHSTIPDKLDTFERLQEDVLVHGVKTPVDAVEREDGRLIIAHGNHRASVAHSAGMPLPINKLPMNEWVMRQIQNDARYGTGRRGRPYQGLPGIEGRRDVIARFQALNEDDLKGARVLDLGCNIGSTTRQAAHLAEHTLGVDYDNRIVTAALRLGVLWDTASRYRVMDLNNETPEGNWDCIFSFSVEAHLKDTVRYRELLTSAKVVYIESNQMRGGFSEPKSLDWFVNKEYVGSFPRPIWRCEN